MLRRVSAHFAARIFLAVLLLVVAGSAVACNVMGEEVDPSDDPSLIALKQEPMATFRPRGGRIVLDLEQSTTRGYMPADAHITRVFAYRDPERATRARTAAIEAAQSSGWKLNLEGADESPIFGGKTVSTGGITLIIGWYEKEGLHSVSVRLEHDRCGRGRCR